MPLISCEINLIVTWSDKGVLSYDTKAITFAVTDTELYVPSADNEKLLQHLKSCFERTNNCDKDQSRVTIQGQTHI